MRLIIAGETAEQNAPMPRTRYSGRVARAAAVMAIAVFAANCSQQKIGGIDPKYGVRPSPRVVADGQPVPKGGGRELVGGPYQVAGRTYVPRENPRYVAEGSASWYGSQFHGRLTANGEVFDRYAIAAAHTTMPLPSYARVTNLHNKRSIIVRVNDRGPFHGNRIMDVSQRVAEALDFKRMGTAKVRVEYVGPASPRGSDDRILMATLRTDGAPAQLPGVMPTMVADAGSPRTASPQQSLTFRSSTQPTPETNVGTEASTGATPLAASEEPATGLPTGKVVTGIPLPPERPFDLGTIPNAAKPVPVAAPATPPRPPSRPIMAGLYFADPSTTPAEFRNSGPFSSLAEQKFVSFRAQH